jgi:hypothetical protein
MPPESQPLVLRISQLQVCRVEVDHLRSRVTDLAKVALNTEFHAQRFHEQAVTADEVAAGQIVELVEGCAGVAVGAGQGPCRGRVLAVAGAVVVEVDGAEVVHVVAAAAHAVEVEGRDKVLDFGWGRDRGVVYVL